MTLKYEPTKWQLFVAWFTIIVSILFLLGFGITGLVAVVAIASKLAFWNILLKLFLCSAFGVGGAMGLFGYFSTNMKKWLKK